MGSEPAYDSPTSKFTFGMPVPFTANSVWFESIYYDINNLIPGNANKSLRNELDKKEKNKMI